MSRDRQAPWARCGMRVRSLEYGQAVGEVVDSSLPDMLTVRVEGDELTRALDGLLKRVMERRAAGVKVEAGLALAAHMLAAENKREPFEMVWCTQDLVPVDSVH